MTEARSHLLSAYRLATSVAHPLAPSLIKWRVRRGKEDPARVAERYGIASAARPDGPLVWVHAASVGETLSVLPLLERILAKAPVAGLLTSGTVTSTRIAQTRLTARMIHQYAPLDGPRFVRRFLGHWQPDLAIFAESELWPNMIVETSASGARLALVNGRMSNRSFARWRDRGAGMARHLLGRFDLCLAQSQADADRLSTLSGSPVDAVGNLKFDVPAPPCIEKELSEFKRAVSDRPCWLAASIHPGEDEITLDAHARLAVQHPGLISLIAPRHPERGPEMAARAAAAGAKVGRRATDRCPSAEMDIFIMDTIGELGLVFRIAPVAFMGGSLVPHGGQNPIEPAKLGTAILHGPHVANFLDVYAAMDEAGGAGTVDDAAGLASAVGRMLAEPEAVSHSTRTAAAVVERFSGALDRTMDRLAPLVAAVSPKG